MVFNIHTIMNITIKQLQGGEFPMEVTSTTRISEIKQHIAARLDIAVEEQKLLLLGRTLADEQTVDYYPTIKEGSKLNLVVKKPEGLLEASMKYFKRNGMSEAEARNAANQLLRIVEEKIYMLSWDDIERLCLDCMMEECGVTPGPVSDQDTEPESEDGFGL